MPLYLVSVSRRKQNDAEVKNENYVTATTRVNALTAFEATLTVPQRNHIESVVVEEVAATVIMGS